MSISSNVGAGGSSAPCPTSGRRSWSNQAAAPGSPGHNAWPGGSGHPAEGQTTARDDGGATTGIGSSRGRLSSRGVTCGGTSLSWNHRQVTLRRVAPGGKGGTPCKNRVRAGPWRR